jgi:cytochrome c-type biogenesis protein CcmH
MAQGRNLIGEPEKLVARALKLEPTNVKALALAGTAAFQRSDYRGALGYWRQALPLIPEGAGIGDSIRSGIAEAENRLGAPAVSNAPARVARDDAGSRSAPSVKGRVSLAPAAAGRVRPDDSVFVYARAAEGPRMPLAILRRQVKDLPFEFVLDDSMAMNPSLKLSDFGKVVVVARVSRSGLATPQKGDLQVTTAPLVIGTKGIRLEIDRSVE